MDIGLVKASEAWNLCLGTTAWMFDPTEKALFKSEVQLRLQRERELGTKEERHQK